MKSLLVIAFVLVVATAFEDNTYTCWDVCRWRCKATNGQLTSDCIKSCECTCDSNCEKFCEEYGLGWSCRFKCGCFQNYNFDAPGNLLVIP